MRTRNLVIPLAALICVLFSAAHVTAARRTVDIDGREHALSVSKAVPNQLNYQGFLVDATDSSAVTATLEMTFRLFDSETKGTELWSETHPAVEVSNGLFQVLLGSITSFPAGLFDGSALWLQTELDTEILSPRKPLVSVAYSQKAVDADQAASANWATEAQHAIYADTADYTLSAGVWTVDGDNVYRETGRVGIGTASPLTELDVNGSVNATTYYGDGSNLTGISETTDNDWTIAGDDVYHETGNVGIGISSPAYPLHVDGIASTKGLWLPGAFGPDTSYVGEEGNYIAFGHPGASEDFLGYKNNTFYFMDSPLGADTTDADVIIGGNVGIGTESPLGGLHVKGDGWPKTFMFLQSDSDQDAGIRLYEGTSVRWHLFNANTFDNGLRIAPEGNYGSGGITVLQTGDVGIGTTSPGAGLHVKGYGWPQSFIYVQSDQDQDAGFRILEADTVRWHIFNDSPAGGLHIFNSDGSKDVFFAEQDSGYVGIGTASPAAKLEVRGSTGLRVTSQDYSNCYGDFIYEAGGGGLIINSRTGGSWADISFQTNGATRMFMEYNGDVGIGTTSPSKKLEVVASGDTAVYGLDISSGNYGYLGSGLHGVRGVSTGGSGVSGSSTSGNGVFGYSNSYRGVYAFSGSGTGLYAYSGGAYAGYFNGNVHVTGTLTGGKTLIDHPLDPENKLLRHTYVESPENLLLYRGKVQLDNQGEAVVQMPGYFRALTKESEATIHLTAVGRPFLTGYEWNSDGASFRAYGEPNREVSWMVMVDRDDPVIRQLARPVEEDKGPDNILCDRGELLYPAAYGYPVSMGKDYKDRPRLEGLNK